MARTNLLPLGSVVMLNSASQQLLVVGRALKVQRGEKEYFFDYGGILYPQGIVGDQIAYFNHQDISKVYFIGYNDEASKAVTDMISDYIEAHPEIERCTHEEWEKDEGN